MEPSLMFYWIRPNSSSILDSIWIVGEVLEELKGVKKKQFQWVIMKAAGGKSVRNIDSMLIWFLQ